MSQSRRQLAQQRAKSSLGASVEVGDRVSLINDPGRVGIFTGNKGVVDDRDYVRWPSLIKRCG